MAFKFSRQEILPLFLQTRLSVVELSRRAGVAPRTVDRAVNGEKISAGVVDKIAQALGIDAMKFLIAPNAQL